MIIGMPTYGLTYILVDPNQAYMGAPTTGKGFSGPWSKTEGLMGYNEVRLISFKMIAFSVERFSVYFPEPSARVALTT